MKLTTQVILEIITIFNFFKYRMKQIENLQINQTFPVVTPLH